MTDGSSIEFQIGKGEISVNHIDRTLTEVREQNLEPQKLHTRLARIEYASLYAQHLANSDALDVQSEYERTREEFEKKIIGLQNIDPQVTLNFLSASCDTNELDAESDLASLPIPHLAARLGVLGYIQKLDGSSKGEKLQSVITGSGSLVTRKIDTTDSDERPKYNPQDETVILPGASTAVQAEELFSRLSATRNVVGTQIIYLPTVDENGKVREITKVEMRQDQVMDIYNYVPSKDSESTKQEEIDRLSNMVGVNEVVNIPFQGKRYIHATEETEFLNQVSIGAGLNCNVSNGLGGVASTIPENDKAALVEGLVNRHKGRQQVLVIDIPEIPEKLEETIRQKRANGSDITPDKLIIETVDSPTDKYYNGQIPNRFLRGWVDLRSGEFHSNPNYQSEFTDSDISHLRDRLERLSREENLNQEQTSEIDSMFPDIHRTLSPEEQEKYEQAKQYFKSNIELVYGRADKDISPEKMHEALAEFESLLVGVQDETLCSQVINEIFFILQDRDRIHGENNHVFMQKLARIALQKDEFFAEAIGKHGSGTDYRIGGLFRKAGSYATPDEIGDIDILLQASKHAISEGASQRPDRYTPFIEFYLANDDLDNSFKFIVNMIDGAAENDLEEGIQFFSEFLYDSPDIDIVDANDYLEGVLQKRFGEVSNELIAAWNHSGEDYSPKKRAKEMSENWATIEFLRKEDPQSVDFMVKEYGIHHFGRYPKEILIDQYRKREIKDKSPYFVVIYPYDDWNGAFHDDYDLEVLESFWTQAANIERNLRIIEAGSGREIIGRLNRLHRNNGLMAGGIIGAHGSAESMRFGPKYKADSVVEIFDILGNADTKPALVNLAVNELFAPQANLVLSSCSTGDEMGMAYALSTHNIKVIGPAVSTSLKSISVKAEGDKVSLGAEYWKPGEREYESGRLNN